MIFVSKLLYDLIDHSNRFDFDVCPMNYYPLTDDHVVYSFYSMNYDSSRPRLFSLNFRSVKYYLISPLNFYSKDNSNYPIPLNLNSRVYNRLTSQQNLSSMGFHDLLGPIQFESLRRALLACKAKGHGWDSNPAPTSQPELTLRTP